MERRRLKRIIAKEGLIIVGSSIIIFFASDYYCQWWWKNINPEITDETTICSTGVQKADLYKIGFAVLLAVYVIRFVIWAVKTLRER